MLENRGAAPPPAHRRRETAARVGVRQYRDPMHEIPLLDAVPAPTAFATPGELYAQALAERLHSAARLRERAGQLRAAHAGAAWQARSALLEAWADTYDARLDRARSLARQALGQCLVEGDDAGAADARDLMARHAIGERNLDEARVLLQRNLALPEPARSDAAWCVTFYRQAVLCEIGGRFEEALRWHYRNAAMAPRTGLPAEHALALAGAGGLQLSLHNTDDAASLLSAAWEIAQPRFEAWDHLWPVVAVNHLTALRLAGRLPEAQHLAALVQARLARFAPGLRAKVMLLLASVHVEAGDAPRARALLEAARGGTPDPAPGSGAGAAGPAGDLAEPVEWVVAQARLELQQGRAAEALRLCEAHFAAAAAGRLAAADTPMDLHLLQSLRARAHRALGDEAAALAAERASIAAERELLGGATRAQRLTLQIRYELEAAERARDEAQRRAEAAQRERERLAELNTALAAASRAKTRWMAAASHDLRQPLQALGLQLARLKPMLGDAEAREVAARIEGAHDALRAMFDALLDLSRIDGGAVVPQRQAVPLRPLCARLADEMAPLAEARGLRLALYLPMDLPAGRAGPPLADSDPALLETLLRNLLDNALKYTRRGGVVLALRPPRAGGHAASGGAAAGWRLQVRDTGPGIDVADQARVFGEFVRLHDDGGEGADDGDGWAIDDAVDTATDAAIDAAADTAADTAPVATADAAAGRASGTVAGPVAGAVPGVRALGAHGAGRTEGLGLGLSIVQRLARMLGHTVELRSRAGRGCLFEVAVAAHGGVPGATPGAPQAGAAGRAHAGMSAAVSPAAQSRQTFEAL